MPALPDSLAGPSPRDLGRRTARGALVVAAAQLGRQLVALAGIAVLARLLTPHEYGLAGMAMAVVAFVSLFSELGLSAATVQKDDLTPEQVSGVFWVSAATGAALTALLASCAPLVARFYGEPRVEGVVAALSLGFVVSSLGAQHNALLSRRMAFGRASAVDATAFVAATAAGIGAAVAGWGVYALVAQFLTERAFCTAGYWAASGWRPGRPRRGAGVRSMLRLGGYLSAFNVVNYFARNLDRVLLGRVWGADSVGLYSRAYTLMMVPMTFFTGPLQQVMVPALSRVAADRDRFESLYLRALRAVAAVSFPTMAGLLVAAEEAVAVVMGPQWGGVVPIFRVLALSALVQAVVSPVGWLYVASGRTDRLFRWSLIATPLIAAGFVAGLRWGALGVAIGYAAVMIGIAGPLAVAYALRTVGLRWAPLLRALGPLVLPAVASTALLWALRTWVLLPLGLGSGARLAALVAAGALTQLAYHGLARDGLLREVADLVVRRRAPELPGAAEAPLA